jgi:hypothetical protein
MTGKQHPFREWPEDAKHAYRTTKRRVNELKAERDVLRDKRLGARAATLRPIPVDSVVELTLDWERWMDGRIHRLKRGKHFTGDVSAVLEEARLAARLAGRGVLQLREQMGPKYQYVWVQFTDYSVLVGDPCHCGGRKLDRLHASLARCRRCGKTLMLTPR